LFEQFMSANVRVGGHKKSSLTIRSICSCFK